MEELRATLRIVKACRCLGSSCRCLKNSEPRCNCRTVRVKASNLDADSQQASHAPHHGAAAGGHRRARQLNKRYTINESCRNYKNMTESMTSQYGREDPHHEVRGALPCCRSGHRVSSGTAGREASGNVAD
ncbi:hypothetical protein E2C01_052473 [Portunus trituberculatus]|uniref:Uncharacterized protein n=1 Tax=Portunus trituberculatus TaxID=210409 RepID=A0A5B7GN37_PORTR|nr:hypothetical protein [Portunus trituberculatus]